MSQGALFAQPDIAYADRIAPKAYCCDGFLNTKVRAKALALRCKYLQHNHFNSLNFFVFDCDYELEKLQTFGPAPEPNFCVVNPENRHFHAFYALGTPVHKNSFSSIKALNFASFVQNKIALALDADPAYGDLLSKNRLHSAWDVVDFFDKPYEPHQLDINLDPAKCLPSGGSSGLGRNVSIFNTVRRFAYSRVFDYKAQTDLKGFGKVILHQCRHINATFPTPLHEKEVSQIARSVALWTWTKYTRRISDEAFGALQSKRVSMRAVHGGGRPSLGEPWLELGISRATYFRRRAAGLL